MKTKHFISFLATSLAVVFTFSSCGPSKAVLAARSAATIEEAGNLEYQLVWLQVNAKDGGNYVIVLDSNEKITGLESSNRLAYKDKENITITLKGNGGNKIISSGGANLFSEAPRSVFGVGSGVTLVLDNITLIGNGGSSAVIVSKGGTFVINDGTTITRNKASYHSIGGGVLVADGIFLMKGGTISGNKSSRSYTIGGGQSAGKYFTDISEKLGGGGVWVTPNGTFIKTGGTITNNSVEDIKRELLFKSERSGHGHMEIRIPTDEKDLQLNVLGMKTGGGRSFIQNKGYVPVNSLGNQIYFEGSKKAIDTTVGPEINITFKDGVFSESRNEEVISQSAAESENTAAEIQAPAQ
ncbi:MAG: hypothetical protein FWH22_11085 [Fibromonadales bacterium]|nr:hypothetical protein [Fibromonadales bacterium]